VRRLPDGFRQNESVLNTSLRNHSQLNATNRTNAHAVDTSVNQSSVLHQLNQQQGNEPVQPAHGGALDRSHSPIKYPSVLENSMSQKAL
jgi:hypothetical protein